MIRQFELVERIKAYNPDADEDFLNRGYVFAMKSHGSQKRANGDPYFIHPLEVAGILTGYRLDVASIVTALLHDTIEDAGATYAEIQNHFGDEVAQLVNGVTKLSLIELQSEDTKQAENFRKLLLAMSQDIRVLLVKLADRLHNMRTLHFIDDEKKRRRIANETMDIYAPLAERMGMQEMKSELEDLAFAEINVHARESIVARLKFLREQGGDLIPGIIAELSATLTEREMPAKVFGREKTPYSVWRKMQRNHVGFEQLSDIMAFRIIVDSVDDCYRALGIVHSAYPVVPGRFKDYLSTPKPNGYRSLHTGVLGPGGNRIEIQIRTQDMHELAEYGIAAHWSYKNGAGRIDGKQYRWLRQLLDILEYAAEPEEFFQQTKLEMFPDEVFCFTPKGDLINLPRDATPVDFAYAVHSVIGDTCVGCRINGQLKPLRTVLHNGDQVEIITSKAQTPSPTWERFVVTGKAAARIRRFVRSKEREEWAKLGRSILQRAFAEEGYEYADNAVAEVLRLFKQSTAEDLCAHVGAGHVTGRAVLEATYPATKKKRGMFGNIVPLSRARKNRAKAKTPAVPIKGLIPGMALHYADCCHPLPGDRIVGLVTTGKGVTIHTIDCDGLAAFADMPERWIDVSWNVDTGAPDSFMGRIEMTVLNEPGTLANVCSVIANSQGNITDVRITNRTPQFFDMSINVEVRDVRHLTEIIAALRVARVVNSAERARG